MSLNCRKYLWIIAFYLLSANMIYSNSEMGPDEYSSHPISNLGSNIYQSFIGFNSLYHIAGILSTYSIIELNIDSKVHNYFVKHKELEPFSVPAVYIGYLFPIALGSGLLTYGYFADSSKTVSAAWVVAQSAGLALIYNGLLKAVTGRPNPEPIIYEDNSKSKIFKFGFLKGGIHYGWPSGHLMTTVAIASGLLWFYKENIVVKIIGSVFVGYMFFGVIAHDANSMHWFSDTIAGTLMGYAIGSTVGKSYRRGLTNSYNQNDTSFRCIILPQHEGLLVSLGLVKKFPF